MLSVWSSGEMIIPQLGQGNSPSPSIFVKSIVCIVDVFIAGVFIFSHLVARVNKNNYMICEF